MDLHQRLDQVKDLFVGQEHESRGQHGLDELGLKALHEDGGSKVPEKELHNSGQSYRAISLVNYDSKVVA